MKSIMYLKFLSIFTVVELTVRGTGLNVVPPLPESVTNLTSTNESESDTSWFTSWNTPPIHSWKGFDLRSTLDYKAFYTDNPLSNEGSRKGDFMHYVSPLIGLSRSFETEQRATLVSVAYQPTFVISSLGNGGDRTYQLIRGNLSYLWKESSVYLSHQFQESSESSSQIAFLTPQQENRTAVGLRTPLTGKMNAEFSISQALNNSLDSKLSQTRELRTWVASSHVDYQLRPKIQTGVRFNAGYSEQHATIFASRFLSEGLLSTWHYQVSGKVAASFEIGEQVVQSLTSSVPDPKMGTVATGRFLYEPRYGTAVVISGGRNANASQFVSASFLTESMVDLSVGQRIYEDFMVSGRFSYAVGEYQQLISNTGTTSRNYNSYTLSTDLQWRINARVTSALFYQYLRRLSDFSTESYSANQFGVRFVLSL